MDEHEHQHINSEEPGLPDLDITLRHAPDNAQSPFVDGAEVSRRRFARLRKTQRSAS